MSQFGGCKGALCIYFMFGAESRVRNHVQKLRLTYKGYVSVIGFLNHYDQSGYATIFRRNLFPICFRSMGFRKVSVNTSNVTYNSSCAVVHFSVPW